ncbi:carboxylate-amine ligase [Pseudomonas sp. SWRI153]|uniref:Putative glutamate--cysteine ligase 2 n=1 Tax=Pseudomonas khorasanensis TaxID=2745508 RepID=A0A923JCT5_9PSED|nr:carboxylate-amine ligase [Pseudomonas khorasanensis]MBV4484425.1 carboxylate-amine ligase [Pseudomonas khorasanensis]
MTDPRFGIEEEYFVTDLKTLKMVGSPPFQAIEACREVMGAWFATEMFQGQIEVASPIFSEFAQASDFLRGSRQALREALEPFGLGVVCAGSHPLADWREQVATDEEHFHQLFERYGHVARRSVLSGLHVHVEVAQPLDRIAVMNEVLPWTPLLLALSCSSPLWDGASSGFMSYRQTACDEWPRMGIPPLFVDQRHYDEHLAFLSRVGAISQPGECWWGIRPAVRYPTLELRMTDACPRVDDALTLAAFFRVLVAHASAQRRPGLLYDQTARSMLGENRWRAKRFGIHGRFIVEGIDGDCSIGQWLALAEQRFADTAQGLGTPQLFERARAIIDGGTSADRQLALFDQAMAQPHVGLSVLAQVTDLLLQETVAG